MPILTEEQKNIVYSKEQHILVAANAGCGKTSTMIEKIKYLIEEKNIDPNRILLTSFSRSANIELHDKVEKKLSSMVADSLTIGTVHSICFKILLDNKEKLNLPTIELVNESYLTTCVFNLALQRDLDLFESKRSCASLVGKYRKNLISRKEEQIEISRKELALLEEAQSQLEQSGKLVFDDLMLKVLRLFKDYPKVREYCANKFDCLIIDECLPYYIPVHLADGSYRYIGDIVENKESVEVLSYNEETHRQEKCVVSGWSKTPNKKPMVKIASKIYSKGKSWTNFLVCTIDHKVYTYNRGWVEAGEIAVGDILQIETEAHKDQRYKISDIGKQTLSRIMYTDGKAQRNSKIGNSSSKIKKLIARGGNGKGLTRYQEYLYDQIVATIGGCWNTEGIVVPTKEIKLKYRTPNHYKVDILNQESKICVELDGKSHNTLIGKDRDSRKTQALQALGYTILRYKNLDVYKHLDSIMDDLSQYAISDNCILQSKVTCVQPASTKEDYVYDITVENCHNFYANGILVHNCQDLSYIQWEIIKALIAPNTLTCCVGDAKQNIYGFRGASYKYMNDFRDLYNSKVLPLSETFRFGQEFANLSNKVVDQLTIAPSYKEYTKTNVSCLNKPQLQFLVKKEQVEFITNDILEKVGKQLFNYGDLNIIFRKHKESFSYMKSFLKNSIPFEVKNGDIFERPEIKFLLKVYCLYKEFNLADCIDLLNYYSNNVGDKGLNLIYTSTAKASNIIEFFENSTDIKIKGIGSKKSTSLIDMKSRFKKAFLYLDSKKVQKINLTLLAQIMDMQECKFMWETSSEEKEEPIDISTERWEFLKFFQEVYDESKYADLCEWYQYVALDGFKDKDKEKKSDKNKVQLKTVHASKGQSLPVVYLLGDSFFDPFFTKTEEESLDELFVLYVATTRAEKEMNIFIENPYGSKIQFLFPEDWNKELLDRLENNYDRSSFTMQDNRIKKEVEIVEFNEKDGVLYFDFKNSLIERKKEDRLRAFISQVGYKDGRYFLSAACINYNFNKIRQFIEI